MQNYLKQRLFICWSSTIIMQKAWFEIGPNVSRYLSNTWFFYLAISSTNLNFNLKVTEEFSVKLW